MDPNPVCPERLDPDPVCPEWLDPDPVCPERLDPDPDPVNIRPDPKPCTVGHNFFIVILPCSYRSTCFFLLSPLLQIAYFCIKIFTDFEQI